MAFKRFWTIETEHDGSTEGLGTSDQARLKKLFPASPAQNGYTDEEARKLMNSVIHGKSDSDVRLFPNVDMDFGAAPELNIDTDLGVNAIAYAPNIASAEGADKPDTIPEEGKEATKEAQGGGTAFVAPVNPGSGPNPNPKSSAQSIAEQDALFGTLKLGSSS